MVLSFRRILFGKLLFFASLLLVFLSLAHAGTLSQTIYSPFGTVVSEQSSSYTSDLADERTISTVTSRFSDFALTYESGSSFVSDEPYCRIGGWYTIDVVNDPTPGAQVYRNSFDLYYCKTTKDLISNIMIPSSWADDELVLYCNDGQFINFPSINFEVLTSKLNTYKLCIVKNSDLTSENTLIYGFESGNDVIDSDQRYYFNSAQLTNPIIEIFKNDFNNFDPQLQSSGGVTIVKYVADGKDFFLSYNPSNSLYVLKDTGANLDTPITSVFSLGSIGNFGLSRVALFRSFDSGKVYGYESASINFIPGTNNIDPVYRIELDGFNLPANVCSEALASYGAENDLSVDASDKIICNGLNQVLLNGRAVDNTYGEHTSFNLFKNVILSLEK